MTFRISLCIIFHKLKQMIVFCVFLLCLYSVNKFAFTVARELYQIKALALNACPMHSALRGLRYWMHQDSVHVNWICLISLAKVLMRIYKPLSKELYVELKI